MRRVFSQCRQLFVCVFVQYDHGMDVGIVYTRAVSCAEYSDGICYMD